MGRGACAWAKYAAPMSKKIPAVMKGKRAIVLWSEPLSRKLGVLRFYYLLTIERPASRNLPKINFLTRLSQIGHSWRGTNPQAMFRASPPQPRKDIFTC